MRQVPAVVNSAPVLRGAWGQQQWQPQQHGSNEQQRQWYDEEQHHGAVQGITEGYYGDHRENDDVEAERTFLVARRRCTKFRAKISDPAIRPCL